MIFSRFVNDNDGPAGADLSGGDGSGSVLPASARFSYSETSCRHFAGGRDAGPQAVLVPDGPEGKASKLLRDGRAAGGRPSPPDSGGPALVLEEGEEERLEHRPSAGGPGPARYGPAPGSSRPIWTRSRAPPRTISRARARVPVVGQRRCRRLSQGTSPETRTRTSSENWRIGGDLVGRGHGGRPWPRFRPRSFPAAHGVSHAEIRERRP